MKVFVCLFVVSLGFLHLGLRLILPLTKEKLCVLLPQIPVHLLTSRPSLYRYLYFVFMTS